MRGVGDLKAGDDGIGGFTEAVLALMVVTLAVVLLSASLSFTGIGLLEKGGEASSSALCDDVWVTVSEDEMIWDGDIVVLTSYEMRATSPYAVSDGLFGYEITLTDMTGNGSAVQIIGGVEVEGADVHAERHPVLLRTDSGMRPGMIEVRVW